MGIRILIPRPQRRCGVFKTRRFVWAAVGIALWGVAYTIFGAGGMVGSMRARAQLERLADEVEAARMANEQLRADIDAVRDDPAAVERYAREDLYLARPGEKVYLLPPSEQTADPGRTDTPEPADENPASLPRQ